MVTTLGAFSLDRVVSAVEKVRQRVLRASAVLKAAGVPYAVAGGNAVALWVSRVDEAAVRNTQDVDVLLRRSDWEKARQAMEAAGFVYRHVAGLDVFLDGPDAKPRDGVHILFARERVRPESAAVNPDVDQSEAGPNFQVLSLEALVQTKLAGFRRKDQVHLLDLIGVGLIDDSWPARYPSELAARLQTLLNDPDG